jgi:hypothetical protein
MAPFIKPENDPEIRSLFTLLFSDYDEISG